MNNTPNNYNIDPMYFRLSDLDEIFANVEPIPQDDGPGVVCCIDYPPGFTKAYDYFRAVIQQHELSPRVFGLTSLCLQQNPANYTVWHVRRQCFIRLLLQQEEEEEQQPPQPDNIQTGTGLVSQDNENPNASDHSKELLMKELTFAADLGGSNPKNYQVWYHRRSLLSLMIEKIKKSDSSSTYTTTIVPTFLPEMCEAELSYINSVLRIDGKNYHAWSHRQWFVLTLHQRSVYESELSYTAQLIERDIRNNSAWNHRWFIVHNQPYDDDDDTITNDNDPNHPAQEAQPSQQQQQPSRERPLPRNVIESEANYALAQVLLDPYNESSCRYLLALLKEDYRGSGSTTSDATVASTSSSSSSLLLIQEYLERLQTNVLVDDKYPDASSVLSTCADLYELLEQYTQSTKFLTRLVSVDPIRTKYWTWRLEEIANRNK